MMSAQENECGLNISEKYDISNEAPYNLSIPYFLNSNKYRTIHHDTFCRLVKITDTVNNIQINDSDALGYKTISTGTISMGINLVKRTEAELTAYFNYTTESNRVADLSLQDYRRYKYYASNFSVSDKFGRAIKYININRSKYHVNILRAIDDQSDSKFAFFIMDIDNFYYACISSMKIEICQYLKGKQYNIFSVSHGGNELEVYVDDHSAQILVDGIKLKKISSSYVSKQICGLLFENTSISNVDEFIVNYEDEYKDVGLDEAIENDDIRNGVLGYFCSFENRCSASRKNVKSGNKALKFTLLKPTNEAVLLNRDKAVHSTFMLNGNSEKGGNNYWGGLGGNRPLDSYVFSADVFFPTKGDEKWILDDLYQELIIQEHHVGWPIPFSPSISININKGRLYLNTIWQESLPVGDKVHDNPTTTRRQYFGRINTDEEEECLSSNGHGNMRTLPEYKKGIWHNITLYVKLGYTKGQKPRTILYLDNQKVIDWDTPNAYNCQEYGEYLEFGIYKWDWEKEENRDKSPIKKRVIYFDNIHYYI